MNKLDVALRLVQLLNERERLNSRLVAGELNVSMRTAQRYLLELSRLPCVIVDEEEHSFRLNPDYPLKTAITLGNSPEPAQQSASQAKSVRQPRNRSYCAACVQKRRQLREIPALLNRMRNHHDPRRFLNQLIQLILDAQGIGQCNYP